MDLARKSHPGIRSERTYGEPMMRTSPNSSPDTFEERSGQAGSQCEHQIVPSGPMSHGWHTHTSPAALAWRGTTARANTADSTNTAYATRIAVIGRSPVRNMSGAGRYVTDRIATTISTFKRPFVWECTARHNRGARSKQLSKHVQTCPNDRVWCSATKLSARKVIEEDWTDGG